MSATAAANTRLQAFALKDAPSLIETVFPAQKVSCEAQRERKAQASQTLTALGSYWKGRKPLILVRAIVLGSLLPPTDDAEQDLEIFEKLMAFDEGGLARRAPNISPAEIARRIALSAPWRYFSFSLKGGTPEDAQEIADAQFPLDADDYPGLTIRWRRDIDEADKLHLLAQTLATFPTYEERAGLCKRPEELDQAELYAPIWDAVNAHYAHLGLAAHSHPELVEQLGVLRYGRRPRVGDTFCGGGSIPFEAARLGCDVYASDLNPIACMLTWGTFNIIGASAEQQRHIKRAQQAVAETVEREIEIQGIEHDAEGNRIKALLYCLETQCPETGWMVPMSTTWIVSKIRSTIARLEPDHANKRFQIRIVSGVTPDELSAASEGTIQSNHLVYELDGRTYRTPVKTLRGDYRLADGATGNRLRQWDRSDFKPREDDILQERLFAIQWVTRDTVDAGRQETYFAAPTEADLERERTVEAIIGVNLERWQREGCVPDMPIEPGDKTDEPIRTRGWTHWHHLYMPRQLYYAALVAEAVRSHPEDMAAALQFDRMFLADKSAKLSQWRLGSPGRPGRAPSADGVEHVFYNQALNVFYNYGVRGFQQIRPGESVKYRYSTVPGIAEVATHEASQVASNADLWITDPPYADAVNYHEITEFFIAWLRKNPPAPFNEWVWDSRRTLAIQGSGRDFRHNMVAAYSAMAKHMPDNGLQCVMFTLDDTAVWSDMVGIVWAAGLQVIGAWYIATETTSELKKGGYVQGTVILMLRKRESGDRPGFKQHILPQVKREVDAQIRQMMHLNGETGRKMGTPVFSDADLSHAGYAAAMKVLTGYTRIGDEDVTAFALRPRRKGETTVVDEIVEQAAETANSLLVPEGLDRETWAAASGIQRFYLRMLDMETTGAAKLDNYQNFAKAFRVQDYPAVMASVKPNAARLKSVTEFADRDLTDRTEIGPTPLGALIVAVREFLAEKEADVVMANLRDAVIDYLHLRPALMDMADFLAAKARSAEVRRAAEAIAGRIRNQRLQ